jgi:hypothetical protein
MVYNFTPYCPKTDGKNLGAYYNKYMELLPNDDDWAILMDHDILFTTYDWYNQICDIIEKNDGKIDDLGMLVVMTNRIGNAYQKVYNPMLAKSNDIQIHRKYGQKVYNEKYDTLRRFSQGGMSGLVMVLKKSVWREAGGFMDEGILGVDNNFHSKLRKKLNKEIYIMEGVYVYHWYRNNVHEDKKHLQ